MSDAPLDNRRPSVWRRLWRLLVPLPRGPLPIPPPPDCARTLAERLAAGRHAPGDMS